MSRVTVNNINNLKEQYGYSYKKCMNVIFGIEIIIMNTKKQNKKEIQKMDLPPC